MLYLHATIITVNSARDIFVDGGILVTGNKIADIGKAEKLKEKYPDEETVDLTGRIVFPGLVSTHMHTAQTLLRGAADDLELVSWLCERIWVLQGNFTAEDGYAAARISIAEMLLTGTTCFLESMFADRYGFDGLCRAVEESGIRGCLGKIVMDIATYAKDAAWAMHPGLVEDREMSLLGALKMWEKWDKAADDRIRVWFGARTPGGVSDALYKEMTGLSKEKNIPITMHCAEVKADREFFASQEHTPMSYCSSVGLLGPSTVLVHMVHLDDSDIAALAETGTHVAHCPTSNAKLASGICRLPELLSSGVNVGLGTDGAPCNNTNDLLQEMKLAAIIHKAKSYDPTIISAEQVMEMATINGAKALGLEKKIGSLEVGKKADFVGIDMRRCHLQPWFSPVSVVVYTATGRDVEIVVVDGKVVVKGGKLVTMDEEGIWREAERRGKEVVERAGLMEKLEEFFESETPPYAILSHTWGPQECSLQDILDNEAKAIQKTGYAKIKKTCEQALRDGLEYAWVDTCCIDKSSSADLSEAINSMFQWYTEVAICYAYLVDVPPNSEPRVTTQDHEAVHVISSSVQSFSLRGLNRNIEIVRRAQLGSEKSKPESSNGLYLADSSNGSLTWGLGRIVCPGRFYATVVLKQVLVNMLLEYDFELHDIKANDHSNGVHL
ncbi:hypothetical protein G7Y89_g13858 [Cudoniella acicularis]|uniref:Amidohydrolase-related domain-containing protein n=1 Tax=Cudoniella acicularis TaxID=354080 RepID=A0A8H4VXU3_9HELO|nr:hypothetical protein G7Y89_g13858 [Cudoniella acicularis]